MAAGALAIDRTDDRLAGPLVLSVLFHLAATGVLLLVLTTCQWCAVVPRLLRPFVCPSRCLVAKTIKITPAYTVSLVTIPPRGRLTAGGPAKKPAPVVKAAGPPARKPARAPRSAAKPRPRPAPARRAKPRVEPAMPPLPVVKIAPPVEPRAVALPTETKPRRAKRTRTLKKVISRIAEAKPSPQALARAKAIARAKALARQKALAKARADALARQKALAKARADALARQKALAKARAEAAAKQKALAAAQARAKKLAAARAQARARAAALEKKLARLKKRARGRTGPRRLSASQKIAQLKRRRTQAFGPGTQPGNYGLPSGRTNGGGGTAESYYATLVKSRVVRTLRRYGRWTRKNVQVTILLRVSRSGRLDWARIHKGSGDDIYDHRVLGAVRGIRQFVPFPAAITRSWLEFTITIYSSAISGRA